MRARLSLVSIAVVLIGGFFSMLAVDTFLRVIERTPLWRILPVVEPILGQPDYNFGFESTPNSKGIWVRENRAPVQINSLGLHDVERRRTKSAGTYRVGLLGDSMVEATQVSQPLNFGALAEAKLRSEGRPIELINLGIAGPNPIRQLLRLEARGYDLDLDLVLANSSADSFLSGALRDDSENPAYVDAGGGKLQRGYAFRNRLSQRYAEHPLGRSFVTLYQNSPLVRMLYLRAKEPWRDILGLPVQGAPLPTSFQQTNGDEPSDCDAATAAFDKHLALWRSHTPEREWKAVAHFLDDFAQSTKSHEVRAIYAVRDLPLAPRECILAEKHRTELVSAIASQFIRRGIRFVDWSEAIVTASSKRNLGQMHGFGFRRGAGHLNYEGHRVWADTLVNVIGPELPTTVAK